jgi:hypothetical protein
LTSDLFFGTLAPLHWVLTVDKQRHHRRAQRRDSNSFSFLVNTGKLEAGL